MSLRYAHLAPDQRVKAVTQLDKRPVLSVSLALPWAGSPGMAATGMPWARPAGSGTRPAATTG